jgi:hypothetical protein
MKCNEILGKWFKNKHGASKIMDTLETYQYALFTLHTLLNAIIYCSQLNTCGVLRLICHK